MPPGPHHHHHGGGFRGGFIGPYPVQYEAPTQLFVVDQGAPETCNPTPPLRPVPGLYRKPDGRYCWPTPRASLGDVTAEHPVISLTVLGLAAVGLYAIFKK